MSRGLAVLILCFAAGGAPAVEAAQTLIPAPYPESFGNSAILPEGAPRVSRHQHLKPDPVPQTLGPNALGNPQTGGVRRHQRLIPTPYWRQYHQFPR